MRRLLCIFVLVLVLVGLPAAAQATEATDITVVATVYPDGSCQTTVTAILHLTKTQELTFPIPEGAQDVTLNGSRISPKKSGQARQVDLSGLQGGMTGDLSFTVTYSLTGLIGQTETEIAQLQVPLLSGFAYPVRKVNFTVNLPGNMTTDPAFSSGYHMTNIEKDLSFRVSGATITGVSINDLKDHETLALLLPVDPAMFPQTTEDKGTITGDDWGIGICCCLALVYWLLFLRFLPPFSPKTPAVPEGLTAGQMRTGLTLQGADLSAMVLSWAQLGYILIQVDRYGRVLLHKRMEMGNERDNAERKRFSKLFAKGDLVDCNSYHYATQCKKTAGPSTMAQLLADARSGNPVILRGLLSAVGIFAGLSLALALGGGAAGRWILGILLVPAGAVSCWFMLDWAGCLMLREPGKLRLWLILAAVWLLLGFWAGQWQIALAVLAITLLGGMMMVYGGRRTETGRQVFGQILGLRRYLRSVTGEELSRICDSDPDYFFFMAPYALALGADRRFARRFGGRKLDRCPYLTTGMDGHRTAAEWNELMRRTLTAMDRRANGLSTERLRKLFRL